METFVKLFKEIAAFMTQTVGGIFPIWCFFAVGAVILVLIVAILSIKFRRRKPRLSLSDADDSVVDILPSGDSKKLKKAKGNSTETLQKQQNEIDKMFDDLEKSKLDTRNNQIGRQGNLDTSPTTQFFGSSTAVNPQKTQELVQPQILPQQQLQPNTQPAPQVVLVSHEPQQAPTQDNDMQQAVQVNQGQQFQANPQYATSSILNEDVLKTIPNTYEVSANNGQPSFVNEQPQFRNHPIDESNIKAAARVEQLYDTSDDKVGLSPKQATQKAVKKVDKTGEQGVLTKSIPKVKTPLSVTLDAMARFKEIPIDGHLSIDSLKAADNYSLGKHIAVFAGKRKVFNSVPMKTMPTEKSIAAFTNYFSHGEFIIEKVEKGYVLKLLNEKNLLTGNSAIYESRIDCEKIAVALRLFALGK